MDDDDDLLCFNSGRFGLLDEPAAATASTFVDSIPPDSDILRFFERCAGGAVVPVTGCIFSFSSVGKSTRSVCWTLSCNAGRGLRRFEGFDVTGDGVADSSEGASWNTEKDRTDIVDVGVCSDVFAVTM